MFRALQGAPGALPEGLRGAEKLLGLIPEMQQLGDAKALAAALARSGACSWRPACLPAIPMGCKATSAGLLRLLAQMPNLPGSTPLGSAGRRHRPGTAASRGKRLAGAEQSASARARLSAAGRYRPVSRKKPIWKCCSSSLPLPYRGSRPTSFPAGADTGRARRHYGHHRQLELPMRDHRDIVPLQIKLQREDQPKRQEKERGDPLWEIELAFDVAPLGPLQVQAQLTRGTLSSQLWAERSATAQLVAKELAHLRERLQAAGLSVGELSCRQGTPPQGPSTTLEQRFVDEKHDRQAAAQAIALSYDGVNAPSLSAKGDDEAEAILAIAREHEVPIYENADR